MSALDQPRKRLLELLDGDTNLLGIHVRRGVLQSTLEDVKLVQQRRLFFAQTTVLDKRLEYLTGVWTTMQKQANQTGACAGLEDPTYALSTAE
jgi:hypothetical protein